MSKQSNTFVVASPVVTSVSAELDYSTVAPRLFGAYDDTDKALREIEETYQTSLTSRKSRLLDDIALVALDFEGMTGKDFDEYVKADLVNEFTASGAYKAIPTRVAMVKVAFLAFANKIFPESEKAQRNLQEFVNVEARPRLLEDGVLEATGKGRKTKSTASQPKDALYEAALILARHGDASLDGELVKQRATMLAAVCKAGGWKLLDKDLPRLCGTLKIKI